MKNRKRKIEETIRALEPNNKYINNDNPHNRFLLSDIKKNGKTIKVSIFELTAEIKKDFIPSFATTGSSKMIRLRNILARIKYPVIIANVSISLNFFSGVALVIKWFNKNILVTNQIYLIDTAIKSSELSTKKLVIGPMKAINKKKIYFLGMLEIILNWSNKIKFKNNEAGT